ncbi:MAG: EAL domain-containing protein [Moorea sp. SIO3I7]|nr:EAL domain-containing protein [Moorena sp. SIO3I7]
MMRKILVIEDEEFVRENIIELLDAEGFDVIGAENGRVGVNLAKGTIPDLIICDVMMPEMDGYSVLTSLRQDSMMATVPFIFLTAKAAKNDFRQGMELGADDYITKPFTRAELLGSISSRLKKKAAVHKHYNTELQEAKNKLNYLIRHDSLTNLPNRLSLRERFKQVKQHIDDNHKLLTFLCLGLDRFNQVNNNLGHFWGDYLLKFVAQSLTYCVDNQGTVARLNGDQFAVIIATAQHKQDVINVVQSILESLSQTIVLDDQEVFITASIGITIYPRDGEDVEQLLNHANQAMLQAKRHGGDQYQFYTSSLNVNSSNYLTLQSSLRYALEREEFQVYYQPQISLETGKIVGAEALLRWHHPELGLIPPAKFIPIAEETGLIISIGEWVLQQACQQAKVWQNDGFTSFRIAVNLSGRQFNKPDFYHNLIKILQSTELTARTLELELTESILVKNTETAIRQLNELKNLGLEIAIDDFGTGYSSLSYLQQFPFDVIKIDQCFVRNIEHKPNQAAITKAIIQMAKSLNLQLIAEGVETQEELDFIYSHKCDRVQGHLISRALPAPEFKRLLNSGIGFPLPQVN